MLNSHLIYRNLSSSLIEDETHPPNSSNRLGTHRQRNGQRRRFATEADCAKGYVFGGENEVEAVKLPRQTKTFSLPARTLSCYSFVMAFKDLSNLHLIS